MCDSKRTQFIGKSKTLLLICFTLIMITPLKSQAWGFGDDETIYLIKDVSITGTDNEKLCLAFKMTQTNFFVPLWWSRDGYVLGVKDGRVCERVDPPYSEVGFFQRIGLYLFASGGNTTDTYYPLTDAEITSYQKSGLLDDPLPVFDQSVGERFLFLLIAVPIIFLYFCWLGIKGFLRRLVSR